MGSGAIDTRDVAVAVEVPGTTNSDVLEGAIIKAVYVELWIASQSTISSHVVSIEKIPSGLTSLTYGDSTVLQDWPNKKNIFFTSIALSPDVGTQPVNILKGWVKIPKSKQRFGLGDRLVINVSATGLGIAYCGFALFKEYR